MRRGLRVRNHLALCLVAFAPIMARAQETGQDIVVTGRGLADAPGDAAYDVVTIDHDRLTTTASGRVEDAVRDVAGLAEFRRSDARSANPTSQGETLRGLGGNAAGRVLVLLDGVPQGDPFAGYIEWPLYLPERIGRVRATRGGGSGAGGSGALVGTLEMDSVDAGRAGTTEGALSAGSYGAVDARAVASARLGGGYATLAGGFARGDGFTPTVPDQQGPADGGAAYRQASFAARAIIPVGTSELQASSDLFTDRRTRGTDFTTNRSTGADTSLRLVGAHYLVLGYIQLRKFDSQFASVNAARTLSVETLDQYNTPSTGAGAKAEFRPHIGALSLRLGGEWRRTQGETNELFSYVAAQPTRARQAGGRADIVGGYAEATAALGALTLTGGGRLDRWLLSDGSRIEGPIGGTPSLDVHYADRHDWAGTGRVGAAFGVGPDVTFSTSAYLGWRLPTLNELYRPFRVGSDLTNPNAALDPERSRGVEASVAWRPAPGAQVKATAFDARVTSPIVNVTLSVTPALTTRQRQNLDAITSRGVEFEGALRRGDWHGAVSVAYSDARVRASGIAAALNGLRPASVAPLQTSATLGWRGLAITARSSSAQYDDDQNTRRLAPAVTVDGVAQWPLTRWLSISARVENLFDAQVDAARSAAGVIERASPRAVWFGLHIRD